MEIQGLSREEQLENLFIAARNARETGDEKTAIKHYEDISAIGLYPEKRTLNKNTPCCRIGLYPEKRTLNKNTPCCRMKKTTTGG